MNRWTPEEIKLLRSDMSNQEIADKIGRTRVAVKDKRYVLFGNQKVRRPEQLTRIEKESRILKLCEKLGVKLLGTTRGV